MKLTIFLSCFNEKNTILKAIEEAKEVNVPDKEIIVVDNCSTDGTRELLENLHDNSLRIVLQPKNFGVGTSVKLGIQMARGKYFYGPGTDLEYKMSDVCTMLKKMEEENLDVVFGSRLVNRKDVSKFAIIKERPYYLATIVTTYLINKWYKKNFTDIIGIKLFKTDILRSLSLRGKSHDLDFEQVSKLCKRGYKTEEVPIAYKPRPIKEGKSINPFDIIPALITMIKIKLFY